MSARRASRDPQPYPVTALAGPFRAIVATLTVAAIAIQAVDFLAGDYARGALVGVIAAIAIIVWQVARRGAIEAAAMILFCAMATMVSARLWLGHGLRDFGIAVYPAILFLGCVFLRSRTYWALSALVLACALALGVAEGLGLRAGAAGARQWGSLANLIIVLAACAAGGRALMDAVRSAFAREQELSGALASAEERLVKIFRSSQNAIVVSRLADGKYLEVNDAYLRMFGHQRADIIGHSSLEVGIWESAAERDRFVREAARRGGVRDFETRLRRSSGEAMEVQLSAERLEIGGEECLVVSTADVSAQREAERRAAHLATRDALTGLPNRVLALDRLERALELARRSGRSIGVLHIGIDRFSAVNESLGRAAGDELLREACTRVESALRPGDTLARLGGDEMLCIADGLAAAAEVRAVAARLAGAFVPAFHAGGHALRLSCSIGACVFPDDASEPELLLRYADSAMRVAKAEGRGRVCLFERAMIERVRDHLRVQGGLRDGIARGELRLAYQPKFHMATGAVSGVEALARWSHPELGSIPPSRFIAIAEESDLILELGAWVLEESCSQLERWIGARARAVPVAVNLSARQLDARLPPLVAERVRAHGLDPGLLELEVTESMLITQPEATRRVLQQISARGSRIVLDDFGVGYSSLGYIKHLPLDGIKIDRSFVSEVASDPHDAAIVGAIVGLAHGLGIRVIAEGIEEQSQLEALRAAGCDEGQGFLLGRPAPGDEIAARLLAREPAERALA